jgi:hypothetical protein
MYTIDKGVELPTLVPGKSSKYPFKDMEIGDSFLVPHGGDDTAKHKIYSSASNTGRRMQRKFTIRRLPEGFRVWRTA